MPGSGWWVPGGGVVVPGVVGTRVLGHWDTCTGTLGQLYRDTGTLLTTVWDPIDHCIETPFGPFMDPFGPLLDWFFNPVLALV